MFDGDKHIQDSERAGHRDTEIARNDGPCMIAKEGRPSLMTLSVGCCLSMGGEISEVHEACKPLVPLAEAPLAVANEAWFQSWMSVSERVKVQGDEMLAQGWEFSAGARYYRAAQYGFVAERHVGWKDPAS
jgi:hypothetical protein